MNGGSSTSQIQIQTRYCFKQNTKFEASRTHYMQDHQLIVIPPKAIEVTDADKILFWEKYEKVKQTQPYEKLASRPLIKLDTNALIGAVIPILAASVGTAPLIPSISEGLCAIWSSSIDGLASGILAPKSRTQVSTSLNPRLIFFALATASASLAQESATNQDSEFA